MSNSYDPIDTCPYDPVHRIMRSRMQYHLTKCSKNWPCSKKKQCPYDARHVINQIEFNYHVSICPQRESMWPYKLKENEKVEDLGILPIDPSPVVAPAEDIWEEEGNVQSYDPIKHTENKLITRILIGAPKSQRKKHRLQERLRISRLADDAPKKEKDPATQSKNNQHASSTIIPSIPKEVSVEAKRVYQPLRSPKELPIDTSNTSKIATINDSTIMHQMQNSVNQNEPLQFVQEKSNTNGDFHPRTTFSYAAATKNVLTSQHQRRSSIESDFDVIESKQYDTEKENNNSSFFNRNKEDLNLQTTCSYAAAAKNVLTNQRQRYSSIESDYDVIESKKYHTEKENNNSSFLNRNKAFDLQASTFSYAAAAKNAFSNQQYSYIESDYDFIESKKWDSEKEDNNSSFSSRSKDVDLPTTVISYAAAAKIVPTLQRQQKNSIESIKFDSKKDNNSLLTNRNKEIFNRERTFNYATAAAKYVPPHLRPRNSNIESGSDVVTESIKCGTETENNSLFTNRNKEAVDMQTTFNYATDADNIPTIRRPRSSSVESDCDIISESIKYNSEKENNSSFFNRNKEDLDMHITTLNYATDAENVPTIRRPRNSSIESDSDVVTECIKCETEKDNNSSFFNRYKVNADMQITFSYETGAENIPTIRRPRNSSVESDCDIISESIKYNSEKENNSSFFNRNEVDSDMRTTFSYATAAKNLSINRRPRNNSIESDSDFVIEDIKCNTETANNSSFVSKNKEYSDLQATTFNYTAATKYVPLNQHQLNSGIENDYLQSTKFSYATATKNVLTNQPQRNSSIDYDMHTASLFTCTTTAKNALINRRPRINSTESDYDMIIESINYDTEKEYNSSFFNNAAINENLVKGTKTSKALSFGNEGHKVQSESLDKTLESLNRSTNYSSITNHGLNRININKPLTSEKKTSRCAADLHFTNLRQYLQNTK